jgi:hypothetical protein
MLEQPLNSMHVRVLWVHACVLLDTMALIRRLSIMYTRVLIVVCISDAHKCSGKCTSSVV